MDADAIAQLVTLVLAVLTLVWHQQRTTDKLRDEVQSADRRHQAALDKLRDEVAHNGQRLARIEGLLRIGGPADAPVE